MTKKQEAKLEQFVDEMTGNKGTIEICDVVTVLEMLVKMAHNFFCKNKEFDKLFPKLPKDLPGKKRK